MGGGWDKVKKIGFTELGVGCQIGVTDLCELGSQMG